MDGRFLDVSVFCLAAVPVAAKIQLPLAAALFLPIFWPMAARAARRQRLT